MDDTTIWSFGPGEDGPNVLINGSKGVQYLEDVKGFVSLFVCFFVSASSCSKDIARHLFTGQPS